jgi:hypothetical protein
MENNTDRDMRRLLRSTSAAMAPEEALHAQPGTLIGVSAAVALDVATVRDLAL